MEWCTHISHLTRKSRAIHFRHSIFSPSLHLYSSFFISKFMDINNVNNNNNNNHVPLSKNMQIQPGHVYPYVWATANTHLNTKSPQTIPIPQYQHRWRCRFMSLPQLFFLRRFHSVRFSYGAAIFIISICIFLVALLCLSLSHYSFSFVIRLAKIRLNLSLVLLPHIIINSKKWKSIQVCIHFRMVNASKCSHFRLFFMWNHWKNTSKFVFGFSMVAGSHHTRITHAFACMRLLRIFFGKMEKWKKKR